jgi:hypothetical protein
VAIVGDENNEKDEKGGKVSIRLTNLLSFV